MESNQEKIGVAMSAETQQTMEAGDANHTNVATSAEDLEGTTDYSVDIDKEAEVEKDQIESHVAKLVATGPKEKKDQVHSKQFIDLKDFDRRKNIVSVIKHLTGKLENFVEICQFICCQWDIEHGGASKCYSYCDRELLQNKHGEYFKVFKWRGDSCNDAQYKQVKEYNYFGFQKGHIIPRGDYKGDIDCMKTTYAHLNFAPMYQHFNRGIWLCKENVVRALVDYFQYAVICTGSCFGINDKQANKDGIKSSFIVPSYYWTVVLVQDYDGCILRFSFLLEHQKNPNLTLLKSMLYTQEALSALGIKNPFPLVAKCTEIVGDVIEKYISYEQLLKSFNVARRWYKKIPSNVKCAGNEKGRCNFINNGFMQFKRGPRGTFLCNTHYSQYHEPKRCYEQAPVWKPRAKVIPLNVRCAGNEKGRCKCINNGFVKFCRGLRGTFLCDKHYPQYQRSTRCYEQAASVSETRSKAIPPNVKCAGNEKGRCTRINDKSMQFKRGPKGTFLCITHYSQYHESTRCYEQAASILETRRKAIPPNVRCAGNEKGRCKCINNGSVQFLRGLKGTFLCFTHYSQYQKHDRCYEQTTGVIKRKKKIPANVKCAGNEQGRCTRINDGVVEFTRGLKGTFLCDKHYYHYHDKRSCYETARLRIFRTPRP